MDKWTSHAHNAHAKFPARISSSARAASAVPSLRTPRPLPLRPLPPALNALRFALTAWPFPSVLCPLSSAPSPVPWSVVRGPVVPSPAWLCRGRDTGCPVSPSQIPACPIRGTGLFVLTRSLRPQEGWPVCCRRSLGTGCLDELRQHVGFFPSFGACTLPLDTMNRSDSRRTFRPRSLSLLDLTCLALVFSAAGVLRASSVSCVVFGARRALRPRQAFRDLTLAVALVSGSGQLTPSPLAVSSFEAESLKRDAGPTCGSRFPGSTLLHGRSARSPLGPGSCPSTEQLSVLGGWLNLSIQFFRSELWRLRHQTVGTFTPDFAQLHLSAPTDNNQRSETMAPHGTTLASPQNRVWRTHALPSVPSRPIANP